MTIGDDGIATRDGTTGKPRCDECGAYDYGQYGHFSRCSQRQPATTYEITVAERPRTEQPASAAGSSRGPRHRCYQNHKQPRRRWMNGITVDNLKAQLEAETSTKEKRK